MRGVTVIFLPGRGAASDSMLALRLAMLPEGDAPRCRLHGGNHDRHRAVGAHAAKDMDRCEDTSSLLQGYGLTTADKNTRTVSSPGAGPRHTIDHILGLARREDAQDCRADTPGTGTESAGKSKLFLLLISS